MQSNHHQLNIHLSGPSRLGREDVPQPTKPRHHGEYEEDEPIHSIPERALQSDIASDCAAIYIAHRLAWTRINQRYTLTGTAARRNSSAYGAPIEKPLLMDDTYLQALFALHAQCYPWQVFVLGTRSTALSKWSLGSDRQGTQTRLMQS